MNWLRQCLLLGGWFTAARKINQHFEKREAERERTYRTVKLVGLAAVLVGGVVLAVKKAGLIGTGLIAAKAAGVKNLGGFSIWRILGISALKATLSHAIGIPLTAGGRRRKLGAFVFHFGF